VAEKVLIMRRRSGDGKSHVCVLLNFMANDVSFQAALPEGPWEKILDSSDSMWEGPGAALPGMLGNGDAAAMRGHSIAVYSAGREK
jgi:maltooligosyltrehalose trehalohydrolase